MGCRASFFDLRRHGATLHREQAPLDVSPLARTKRGTVYTHEAIRLLLWVQGFPFFLFKRMDDDDDGDDDDGDDDDGVGSGSG